MATLYLRPTADSSLGHSCSSGSSGYTLVNEATADDDSTYIYQSISGTSNSSATSVFKVSGSVNSKIKISSLQLQVRAKTTKGESKDTAQLYYNLFFNGVEGSSGSSSITTSYANYGKTYNATDFGFGNTVFDSFDTANLVVHVETDGKKNLSKNDSFQNRVTQVYLLVTYEEVTDPVYTCAAVAGEGIASATVSQASVVSGNSCTFTATVTSWASFDGWFTAASDGTKISSEMVYTATVTSNLTLYARATKLTLNFAIGAQPKPSRGTASVSAASAQYPETVTFTCAKFSEDYVFLGWFTDASYSNLISKDLIFSYTATRSLTLYPRVELLVKKELAVSYGSGATYFDASSVTLDFSLIGIQAVIAQHSQGTSGYAKYNDSALSLLYPSSDSHPAKMDLAITCGRQDTIGSLSEEDYIQFKIDGLVLETYRPNENQGVAYSTEWRTDAAIINSTRNSNIQFYCHQKSSAITRAVGVNTATLSLYFPAYSHSAKIGNGVSAIAEVVVDNTLGCEHETITYNATLNSGATFLGWYSDADCTTLVSTERSYSVESVEDLVLYAKAVGPTLYIKRSGTYIHATAVYIKSDGVWVQQSDVSTLKTGKYKLAQ